MRTNVPFIPASSERENGSHWLTSAFIFGRFLNVDACSLESFRSCLPPGESQMVRPSDRDDSIPTGWLRPYRGLQMRRIHRSVLWFRRTDLGDHHFSVSKAQCLGVPNSLEGFSPEWPAIA